MSTIDVKELRSSTSDTTRLRIAACRSYPGYYASTNGRVFSNRANEFGANPLRRGRLIGPRPLREMRGRIMSGYLRLIIRAPSGKRTTGIHELVLDAFVGPRPAGNHCRHLSGDRLDNRLDNLAWGTPSENAQDLKAAANAPWGDRHPQAKLTYEKVREIRRDYRRGAAEAFAAKYGVSVNTIYHVVAGDRWREDPLLAAALAFGRETKTTAAKGEP